MVLYVVFWVRNGFYRLRFECLVFFYFLILFLEVVEFKGSKFILVVGVGGFVVGFNWYYFCFLCGNEVWWVVFFIMLDCVYFGIVYLNKFIFLRVLGYFIIVREE